MDAVLRRLDGNAGLGRVDRMATVVDPKTGVVQASLVPVAKHYGVGVVVCPPRRGNRKGSVEKSVHYATQRFWRTMSAPRLLRPKSSSTASASAPHHHRLPRTPLVLSRRRVPRVAR
jgi:transposase